MMPTPKTQIVKFEANLLNKKESKAEPNDIEVYLTLDLKSMVNLFCL